MKETKRYSLVHFGPVAYSDSLQELQNKREIIHKNQEFELNNRKYKVLVTLSIYDLSDIDAPTL